MFRFLHRAAGFLAEAGQGVVFSQDPHHRFPLAPDSLECRGDVHQIPGDGEAVALQSLAQVSADCFSS